MKFSGTQFFLKSREEMAQVFSEVPESLTNTQLVAEMCDRFARVLRVRIERLQSWSKVQPHEVASVTIDDALICGAKFTVDWTWCTAHEL